MQESDLGQEGIHSSVFVVGAHDNQGHLTTCELAMVYVKFGPRIANS